jgi:ankyrin repeat protein
MELNQDRDALKPGGRWGTLILRASERAPGSVIDTLIAAGASVNIRDDPKTAVDSTCGYTPLHAAAFHGNLSAVSALLKQGANVRAREEKYHGTPAGWADYAGHNEVRDRILLEPVDLMEALEFQLPERVKAILLEDKQAVNRPFSDYPLYPLYAAGWFTPLAFAVNRAHTDMVQLLLDHGADPTLRNPDGASLSDIAQAQGNTTIAELLQPQQQ